MLNLAGATRVLGGQWWALDLVCALQWLHDCEMVQVTVFRNRNWGFDLPESKDGLVPRIDSGKIVQCLR